MPRYIVGIDLGTTHTAMACADLTDTSAQPAIRIVDIPQTVRPGAAEKRPLLPSCIYLPDSKELPQGSLSLPWQDGSPRTKNGIEYTVGEFARARGAEVPGRLIFSAKSWLCQPGANRRSALLPWNAPPGVAQLSPVEASGLILKHLASAWDFEFGHDPKNGRLKDQKIVLCVPASFDAAARDLTMEAAKLADFDDVTLLEEPQAAFYAWIDRSHAAWRKEIATGDLVLVVDIGGGTTDFSLIAVAEEDGALTLRRSAVGEHILLGGDNMDLALAHAVSGRLAGEGMKLDQWQLRGLALACRDAKEHLLAEPAPQAPRPSGGKPAGATPLSRSHPVAVLGRGGDVIGKSVKLSLEQADAENLILDGFFSRCEPSARPRRTVRSGLREMGLNYAADPSITKHLARFLADAQPRTAIGKTPTLTHPTAILFNGGVMQAAALRERIMDVVRAWLAVEHGAEPRALLSPDLELAVARGAAFYGLALRGKGVRIRGGVARSYYIGVESSAPAVPGQAPPVKALCVVPFGMEEGTEQDVHGAEFGLVVGEPVQFRFLSSTTRRSDKAGDAIENWDDDIRELEPLEATLPATNHAASGSIVPVRLKSKITAVGTLELWCHALEGTEAWKLELNVRD